MCGFLFRFFCNQKGNFNLFFALSIVPIFAAAGVAVDYSAASNQESGLQQALDAAALAAASAYEMPEGQRRQLAWDFFASNSNNPCNVQPSITFSGNRVTATSSCTVSTSLLGVIGIDEIALSGTAVAEVNSEPAGNPMCILSLNATVKKTFLASGGSNLQAIDCTTHVNSSNAEAVEFSGGSTLSAAENCFVGGVKQGLSNMTPQPSATCDPIADPFRSLTQPTVGSCDYFDYNENTNHTLYPGVYCGGMRVSNATFTFMPGLYIIKDGMFESTGGATLQGNGVTFYLTGETQETTLTWSGGGSYNFTAMSTGPLAGFIVYINPNGLKEDRSHVSGGGAITYEGAFYFPDQTLTVSGGGSVNSPSPFTAYVADLIEYTGGGTLKVGYDRNLASVPVPAGFFKNGTATVRLVN